MNKEDLILASLLAAWFAIGAYAHWRGMVRNGLFKPGEWNAWAVSVPAGPFVFITVWLARRNVEKLGMKWPPPHRKGSEREG